MRILISNDDGILAPGLAALRAAVADLGEVAVVAPELPQNASGHSITLDSPLAVRRVEIPGGGFAGLSVAGRPADCVRLAIKQLLKGPVDLVLAGINRGANVGINVFYSGTVAAAAEAVMCGIPAVAFSADVGDSPPQWARHGKLARRILDRLLAAGPSPGDLINVNLPPTTPGLPRGVRVVPQSTAGVEDRYHHQGEVDGCQSYRLAEEYRFTHQADTDVSALAEGYITVTPLHVDMTDHERVAALAGLDWGRIAD